VAEYRDQRINPYATCYQHQAGDVSGGDWEGWGRVGERAAYADCELGVEYGVDGAVEVFGGRVRGVLHSELEVARGVGFRDRGGGGRFYGEAACFGESGDEGVEPLAGEELGDC